MKYTLSLLITIFSTLSVFGQYCAKSLPDGSAVYITRFQLESIDNSSVNSSYSDFTGISTDLTTGSSYTATVDNIGSANQNGRIYIDWNQDFDFDDTDETITFLTDASGQTNVGINVPSGATLGSTRLRLVVSWNGNPSGVGSCDPSGTTSFRIGDVEDYTVSILSPLPVEFLHFTASKSTDEKVKLDWSTATETNNDFFTVQRLSDDGEWQNLEDINGAGNSSVQLDYTHTDEDPGHGTVYYRFKQTDFDGKFDYSKVRVVEISFWEPISVHPNPATDRILIRGHSENLKILNPSGQDVRSQIRIISVDPDSSVLDIGELRSGMYLIVSGNETIRLIKG